MLQENEVWVKRMREIGRPLAIEQLRSSREPFVQCVLNVLDKSEGYPNLEELIEGLVPTMSRGAKIPLFYPLE